MIGHVGSKADGPQIRVSVYTPAQATKKVPIILLLNFGGGPARAGAPPAAAAAGRGGPGRGNAATGEPPNAADILARGWGYATVGYNDIQPDRADAWTEGVIGQTLAPGQTKPAPDEWGTISAWAWGASRIADYLQSDPNVDGSRIALYGFSRLGKTVLWAAAQDERFKAVFSGCAGEMGSALARRDWGETVDDMAQNFPWQFSESFQQWPGRWSEMPVDAHMLISLIAPRPLFVTGGTGDQWADPKGEFLGAGRRGAGVSTARRARSGHDELSRARHPGHHRRSRVQPSHRPAHGHARGMGDVRGLPVAVFPVDQAPCGTVIGR